VTWGALGTIAVDCLLTMKPDSLFYRLFQRLPRLLFELVGQAADDAESYRFTSEEIKETAFRLDGVLVPPESQPTSPLFFIEVQFQHDPTFYRRFFAEIFLYLRQQQPVHPWQAVVLYPTRAIDPGTHPHYETLLSSPQVQRVYLNEWAAPRQTFLQRVIGLGLATPEQTRGEARAVIAQARQESVDNAKTQSILELVETSVAYKLKGLSRKEIQAMLDFLDTELKQTRFYQDVFAEGEAAIILRLLQRRCGVLPPVLTSCVTGLSGADLEALGDALLDFHALSDLEHWLAEHARE
jgi:predicted transposase/invertase (TIGR01784 family)